MTMTEAKMKLVPPTAIAESPEDEHQPANSFSENPATKQEASAPLHGTPEEENGNQAEPPTPIAESPEDEHHQPAKSFPENPAMRQEASAPLHGTPEKYNGMETKMNEQVARGLRLQQSKLVRTGNSLADALTEDPRKDVGEALAQAKVLVYFKLYKIGCVLSVRGGRGLVMRRMKDYSWKWSAPCAVKMSGYALGATIGLETSGFLLLSNSEEDFTRELDGGSNVGFGTGFNACFAVGNQGLSGELFTHTEEAKDKRTKASHHARVVGKSQGLYAGLSFEMSGFKVDQKSNREFYGPNKAPSMAELQSYFAPEEGFERMYRLLDLIETVGLSRKQQKADMISLESSECLCANGVGEEIVKSYFESLDEAKTTSPPNSDTGMTPADDHSSLNRNSAQEIENQEQQQSSDKQTPDSSSMNMNAVEGGAKADLSSTNGRSQEKEDQREQQKFPTRTA